VTTWKIVLEYDGTNYCGWQRQPNAPSVQAEVERALARVLGGTHHNLVASGRTDSGVHALGQVCSFRTQVERPASSVRDGLNALMPHDIACVHAQVAAPDFHARFSAAGKLYRYVLRVHPARSALRSGRVWQSRWSLDLDAMRQGLRLLEGTHDFTSYRAAGCAAKSPVRRVDHCDLRRVEDEVWIEIYGQGFLRHMVRNIVGTAAVVGRGRQPAQWMGELLVLRDRGLAGRTAPGCGLYLVRVDYPG
jgi:tRNA pseudouridine38-40 synthase